MEFKDKQIAEPWSVWSSLITLLGSLITKKVFGFNIILISTLVLVLSFSYYAYLDNLYFVDPIYESDALREYSIEEKLTIRVIAPDNFSYLKKFIEKYSLCQAVHEIQVILPVSKRNIKADNFVYAHTHSKMTMEYVEALTASSSLLSTIPFDTEGILLMDTGVEMSCKDISLLQSVWRSSQVAAVGLIPGLHKTNTLASGKTIFYSLDWVYVWLNQRFSFVLSTAVVVHKHVLQALSSKSHFQTLLTHHPECAQIAPSFYASFKSQAAPIWLDIPFKYNRKATSTFASNPLLKKVLKDYPKEYHGSDALQSYCLTQLGEITHVSQIPSSGKKSMSAKNSWIF